VSTRCLWRRTRGVARYNTLQLLLLAHEQHATDGKCRQSCARKHNDANERATPRLRILLAASFACVLPSSLSLLRLPHSMHGPGRRRPAKGTLGCGCLSPLDQNWHPPVPFACARGEPLGEVDIQWPNPRCPGELVSPICISLSLAALTTLCTRRSSRLLQRRVQLVSSHGPSGASLT